jgi:hypothetical protein
MDFGGSFAPAFFEPTVNLAFQEHQLFSFLVVRD